MKIIILCKYQSSVAKSVAVNFCCTYSKTFFSFCCNCIWLSLLLQGCLSNCWAMQRLYCWFDFGNIVASIGTVVQKVLGWQMLRSRALFMSRFQHEQTSDRNVAIKPFQLYQQWKQKLPLDRIWVSLMQHPLLKAISSDAIKWPNKNLRNEHSNKIYF